MPTQTMTKFVWTVHGADGTDPYTQEKYGGWCEERATNLTHDMSIRENALSSGVRPRMWPASCQRDMVPADPNAAPTPPTDDKPGTTYQRRGGKAKLGVGFFVYVPGKTPSSKRQI